MSSSGPLPVVLLHGALGCKHDFDAFGKLLSQKYPVYTFDFYGHGQLANYTDPISMEKLVEQLTGFVRTHHLARPLVFGYSMGGYAACMAALQHPGIFSGVITLGTKFEWTPEFAASESRALDAKKLSEKNPAFADMLKKKHGHEHWPHTLQHVAGMMSGLGESPYIFKTQQISPDCSVLFCSGDKDRMVPPEETMAAFRANQGSSLCILPRWKHPWEYADLAALQIILDTFVDSLTDVKTA